MAMLPSVFNAADHEPMGDFTPIPEAEYLAQIIESEMKKCGPNAKDPNGMYLKLTFSIIHEKYKGRKLFTNLNLKNKNPQAEEIAGKELRSICDAVGAGQVQDSTVLHGKPMKINVVIKPKTEKYPASNEIKGYKRADGAAPTTPGQAPATNPFGDGGEPDTESDDPQFETD